jgi:hypothetical protein
VGCIVGSASLIACGSTDSTPSPSSATQAPVATPTATVSATPTAAPTPTPAPKPLVFTATGSKETTTFATSGTFTLSWTAKAPAGCSYLSVTATVYAKGANANNDPAQAGPFDSSGCGPYTTQVNVASGQYYLDLGVANGTATYVVTLP